MKQVCPFLFLTILLTVAGEVKAPITKAMIFKNGISAVRRTIAPSAQTAFDLTEEIVPLQGSLWFSAPVVSVVRQQVKDSSPQYYPISNLTKSFAGKKVTLLVNRGNEEKEITGVILDMTFKKEGDDVPQSPVSNAVWIQRDENAQEAFEMIERNKIVGVRTHEKPQLVPLPDKMNLRPIWHFTLSQKASNPIQIDYLTKGLSWQSMYRIVLEDSKTMVLSQDVEIVNRLDDLQDATVYLASGFANFSFGGNQSPMAILPKKQKIMESFDEGFANNANQQPYLKSNLHIPGQYRSEGMGGDIRGTCDNSAFGEEATGKTEDISLLEVKNLSLKASEVCHKVISSEKADYERLVHWHILSKRDANYPHQKKPAPAIPMDALRFSNPFAVPLTTSPIEIKDGGVVLAQVKVDWVNPKQSIVLDITRALSITGKVLEYEVPAESLKRAEELFSYTNKNVKGEIISGQIGGRTYRVIDIQGELTLKNYRKLPARILIEVDFAGTLVQAENNPKETILDRDSSVNPNSRLSWDIVLSPDAEQIIRYRYNAFIP